MNRIFFLLIFVLASLPVHAQTDIVGITTYDFQTRHSVMNNISLNVDGSISTVWTFHPPAFVEPPPYSFRGTGYNYYDQSAGWTLTNQTWNRIEPFRTGYPNIVVTPLGKEVILTQTYVPGTYYSLITVISRPSKGTGTWSISTHNWDSTNYYGGVRACGALSSEKIYAIWIEDSLQSHGTLFFSRSDDGGQTWTTEQTIPFLNNYDGFEKDAYSIDATGDTVAISIGDKYSDMILLKSFDAGSTWNGTIVQKHPIPHAYTCNCPTDYINDSIPVDTVRTNGGDSKVLIDNNGMCHIWFSEFEYVTDTSQPFIKRYCDGLYYWNENLGADTTTVWNPLTGGNGPYVRIAGAQDLNGNGQIDYPVDTGLTCPEYYPWGYYGSGMTEAPSAGIDSNGVIYLSYSSLYELGDTSSLLSHKHIYVSRLFPPYNPSSWSPPADIIPSIAQGGNGEFEEAVFATMARRVLNNTVYILYQADSFPGTGLSSICALNHDNYHRISEIRLSRYTFNPINIEENENQNSFQVSIFPNPSNGIVNLSLSSLERTPLKVSISTFTGIEIKSFSEFAYSSNQKIKLDISGISPGIYLCTITADHASVTRKLVVN